MSQRGCTPLDTPLAPCGYDRRQADTDKQVCITSKQETNMGYISIQINKAKGSADTGASDHIERKTTPKNAPTRTHLNRELVQFPDGVADRTGAISHRIRTAGVRRKITPDQVRAIRIVLSGTHEDMARVQDEGRLSEWCDDNLQWLHRTFGKENTVSAVLHMDEHMPHIHATVVPIVTGERRKAKNRQTEGKRTYRKKADAVRLCADDLLTRERLVAYHDSYAAAMAKYGLLRGIRGSEARHTTTAQYYRDLKRQTEKLESNVQQLQTEAYQNSLQYKKDTQQRIQALIDELQDLTSKLEKKESYCQELKEEKEILICNLNKLEEEQHLRELQKKRFLNSNICLLFREKEEENKAIREDEWKQLENEANNLLNGFTDKLKERGRLNKQELRISILIRAEFPIKTIAHFVHLSPEGVTSIRRRLCAKFSFKEISAKKWDEFIFSL